MSADITVPTQAMGRTMICSLLMANGIQDEQVVQITLDSKLNWKGRIVGCGRESERLISILLM